MAPSYISALVLVLSQVLPFFGIAVESEALMTTIQTIIAVSVGFIVMYRQIVTRKSTIAGTRPQK